MNKETVIVYLTAASAKASQLAQDLRNGRLWEGELSKGIADCIEQLQKASMESNHDR